MLKGIDHVALGVEDLDERIAFMTGTLGMTLKRIGTHLASGGRIAMLADPVTGVKLELVETPDRQTGFLHLAYRSDDVGGEHARLQAEGLTSVRPPFHLDAGKAETAMLQDASGLQVQVICYEADSPDL